MGLPLGPLRANVFIGSIEETQELEGKMPPFNKRHVDDTLTIMLDTTSVANVLWVLNNCQTSVKFTIENRGQWSATLSWSAAP